MVPSRPPRALAALLLLSACAGCSDSEPDPVAAECSALLEAVQSLGAATQCATDLDCNLVGGYGFDGAPYGVFVEDADLVAAELAFEAALSLGCADYSCAVDGEIAAARCRAGTCVPTLYSCNGGERVLSRLSPGDCEPGPTGPVTILAEPSYDGDLAAVCALAECWRGTVTWADGPIEISIAVSPVGGTGCEWTITESDGDGWSQQMTCPDSTWADPVGGLAHPRTDCAFATP